MLPACGDADPLASASAWLRRCTHSVLPTIGTSSWSRSTGAPSRARPSPLVVTALTSGSASRWRCPSPACRGGRKSILFLLCLIPFWVTERWHARLDDPPARDRRRRRSLQMLGLALRPGRVPLQRRRCGPRPGLRLAPVHGGAAGHALDRLDVLLSRRATTSAAAWLTVLRGIVTTHACPALSRPASSSSCSRRQLRDAVPRRQERGPPSRSTPSSYPGFTWDQGSAFGSPAAPSSLIVWAGPEAVRPVPVLGWTCLGVRHDIPRPLARASTSLSPSTSTCCPASSVAVFAFNASGVPSPPWQGFTLDGSSHGAALAGSACSAMRRVASLGDQPQGGALGRRPGGRPGHCERVPVRAVPFPGQERSRHHDALATGDPGRDPRHLDPAFMSRPPTRRGMAAPRPRLPPAGLPLSSLASSPSSPPARR